MSATLQESYSLNNPEAQQTYTSTRRAQDWVPFLIHHLKPGTSLLDCGCGVGSITLDLAKIVAPGQVVGVDMDKRQLEVARANAQQLELTNIKFEQGDVYELQYDPGSFDVALAHTLLQHLSDPLRAIKEMRRVIKPSGLVAISDDDIDTVTISPPDARLLQMISIWKKLVLFNGGSPFYSRNLRGLMLEAGFKRTEGIALAVEHYGKLEDTRRMADVMRQQFSDPKLIDLVISQGWATEAELEAIISWIPEWGDRPDAFMAIMYCAALGWNE